MFVYVDVQYVLLIEMQPSLLQAVPDVCHGHSFRLQLMALQSCLSKSGAQ